MISDIQSNLGRLSQLQNEVATGKRINTPADDPVGAAFTMDYKNQVANNQQAGNNAATAQQVLSYTDSIMSQGVQVIQRAHDLAVQGASDSLSQSDRQGIASEVDQLYQHLVSLGNSQFNGNYIFNGQQTTSTPYSTSNAATVTTDAGQILYDIGDQTTLAANVSGNQFFGDPLGHTTQSTSDNAFAVLQRLETALNNNDSSTIQTSIDQLSSRMNSMLATQADIGARTNRSQLAQSRLTNLTDNVQNLLANTQDADMAKVIVDLQSAQNTQTAALQVGAKVIVPTLVDFLK